jgi:hypothetical protein
MIGIECCHQYKYKYLRYLHIFQVPEDFLPAAALHVQCLRFQVCIVGVASYHIILLYCVVLYCIVLYCVVLYCIVLYRIVLYRIIALFLHIPISAPIRQGPYLIGANRRSDDLFAARLDHGR